MKSFIQYIEESNNLKGSLSGSESSKAVGHVTRYIFPFMSKNNIESSIEKLGAHDPRFLKAPREQGAEYDPKAKSTHVLGSQVKNEEGTHEKGTPVSVVGVDLHDDKKKLLAQTKKHGRVPVAALQKPESLKRPNLSGEAGFSVEKRIAENLGTKAAGSTGESWDYVHNGKGKASGKKSPLVKGVVKETQEEVKAPVVRGESKLDKGKMGQGVVKCDSETGKWSIHSKASKAVAEHMKKTKVVGEDGKERHLLDHLNTFHSDGNISKGFVAKAPSGMARAYLGGIKANSLHIHHKKNNTGTTFTVSDELKGKTNLSHLSERDLDELDGKINVESTRTGSANIIHRPNQPEMRRLALLASQDSKKHKDLTIKEHADQFVDYINRLT